MRHVIEVMGTVVSLDLRGDDWDRSVLGRVEALLREADDTFSTWKPDSPVSRLGRREIRLEDCPPEVALVLDACADLKVRTEGWFDAMAGGRLDPSGYVKGWAAARAADLLRDAGVTAFVLNAGGDVICAGQPEPGRPWSVGISDPFDHARTVATVQVGDGAVATSGTAERGGHVLDPRTGRPALGLASVTVVGADLVECDCLATALLAMGPRAHGWAQAHLLLGVLGIDVDGTLWTVNRGELHLS